MPEYVSEEMAAEALEREKAVITQADPAMALQSRMLTLMENMEARMAALETENKLLRSSAEQSLVNETPNHLRAENRALAPGEDRFARRVVLATPAADPDWVAREIPQALGRIVDSGGLVKNTMESIMSGGDREDA